MHRGSILNRSRCTFPFPYLPLLTCWTVKLKHSSVLVTRLVHYLDHRHHTSVKQMPSCWNHETCTTEACGFTIKICTICSPYHVSVHLWVDTTHFPWQSISLLHRFFRFLALQSFGSVLLSVVVTGVCTVCCSNALTTRVVMI